MKEFCLEEKKEETPAQFLDGLIDPTGRMRRTEKALSTIMIILISAIVFIVAGFNLLPTITLKNIIFLIGAVVYSICNIVYYINTDYRFGNREWFAAVTMWLTIFVFFAYKNLLNAL